ncbi:hypothetical protein SKa4_00061 [Pseudomonas phage vB_PpuM-SKa-4]
MPKVSLTTFAEQVFQAEGVRLSITTRSKKVEPMVKSYVGKRKLKGHEDLRVLLVRVYKDLGHTIDPTKDMSKVNVNGTYPATLNIWDGEGRKLIKNDFESLNCLVRLRKED